MRAPRLNPPSFKTALFHALLGAALAGCGTSAGTDGAGGAGGTGGSAAGSTGSGLGGGGAPGTAVSITFYERK